MFGDQAVQWGGAEALQEQAALRHHARWVDSIETWPGAWLGRFSVIFTRTKTSGTGWLGRTTELQFKEYKCNMAMLCNYAYSISVIYPGPWWLRNQPSLINFHAAQLSSSAFDLNIQVNFLLFNVIAQYSIQMHIVKLETINFKRIRNNLSPKVCRRLTLLM